MAASGAATATTTSLPSNVTTTPSNLSNFVPCPHTFVATKAKQDRHDDGTSDNPRRATVPRVCRLRTRDNAMAIYALVDPIDTNMLASDVSVNMLIEQLSEISFDDDSYKEKISEIMQKISYEIENRLLQMTFDHAEEKMKEEKLKPATPSSVSAAEKLLPALDEAESGAFLFAATVTQSYVYVAYVGNIRAFLVSENNGGLTVPENRPQYYHVGSLHTIDNEDESRRLKNLDVDLDQVRSEGLDKKHSKFTRCIGKLSEKLLSSAALANDVNEARCNPLVCEPTVDKFKILPQDYAFVIMTDKVYQMYLQIGIPEHEIPSHFLDLLRNSDESLNLAQHILDKTEADFQKMNNTTDENINFQDMGLLIHFFQHPKNVNQSPLPSKPNPTRRGVEGEVTVDEVKKFIHKHRETQQKREKNRDSSALYGHKRETQSHNSNIEPFVRFDVYEKLLNDNEELRQSNDFITELLYTQSTSTLDEKLTEYLKEHPSLQCD